MGHDEGVRRFAALCLAPAVVVAACGGDLGTQRTPLPLPSVATTLAATAPAARQAYLAQANAICSAANQEIGTQLAALPQQTVESLTAFVGAVFVPVWRQALAALRALTPPAGDEALLEELWADVERQLDEIEAAPQAFVQREASPMAELGDRFDAYGLTSCGTRRS